MIAAFLFALHFFFLIYIFVWKIQTEDLVHALQNAALIIILFTVGWGISSSLLKLVMEPEGFGVHLDRETFALVILTAAEYFFYKIFFKK